jgi:hypothetical protein
MIYPFIHTKKVPAALWDVAHLYEHMFFEGFYDLVRRRGVDPGVIGYLTGETFEDVIFINVGFYNKEIADMYEDYLASNAVDPSFIDIGISRCEAEDRVTFIIPDKPELLRQIKSFDAFPWTEVSGITPEFIDDKESDESIYIQKKKTAKRFRTVRMAMYLKEPSIEEAAVWLRLSVVMDDVMTCAIREIYPSYALDSEPTMRKGDMIVRIMDHRFERNVTLKQIRDSMKATLENFDYTTNMPYILEHFATYGEQELWVDVAVQYYRFAGYLVGNKKIMELATPQMIERIIKKLQVKVQAE